MHGRTCPSFRRHSTFSCWRLHELSSALRILLCHVGHDGFLNLGSTPCSLPQTWAGHTSHQWREVDIWPKSIKVVWNFAVHLQAYTSGFESAMIIQRTSKLPTVVKFSVCDHSRRAWRMHLHHTCFHEHPQASDWHHLGLPRQDYIRFLLSSSKA